jgi:hypothetical protein
VSDLPLIETGASGLLDALDRGARMRRAGTRFEVAFRFPNDRATVANLAARDIVRSTPEVSERLSALDALATPDARLGRANLEDLSTLSPAERATAHDVWRLADAVRISSFTEYRRLMIALDYPGRRRLVEPDDASVPPPVATSKAPSSGGDRIVLWAPQLRTDSLLLPLAGACADGAPVDVVCAGGDTYGYPCSLVTPANGASALAYAGVIVAAGEDAGTALALAAWRRPLCVPATAGANLWLRGVTTYRPWSRLDIERSIAIARAREPDFERIFSRTEPVRREANASPASGSVCIVVRLAGDEMSVLTARALAQLQHERVEITSIRHDAEIDAHLKRSSTDFTYLVDDGDAPYPEAVSRLVAALEASGDDAASGDTLATYVDAAHPLHVIGYATLAPSETERTATGFPLRTLVRRSRAVAGIAHALTIRVDATLVTSHRTLDSRPAFGNREPIRPNRLPALRFEPARRLDD